MVQQLLLSCTYIGYKNAALPMPLSIIFAFDYQNSNDAMNLVTVIIPAHNYGHLIHETLKSLVDQTHSNWECIIIDDGSQDNTKAVVDNFCELDKRFSYVYQSRQGVSSARNAGIVRAKGEYIQFLDADDLLLPRKLELHVNYLKHHSNVDIVYSDVRYFNDGDYEKMSYSFDMLNKEWLPKIYEKKEAIFYLIKDNFLPINAPLSRANLILKAGVFESNISHCEDWEFWFRCIAICSDIKFLDFKEALSLIRVHPVSASHNTLAMDTGRRMVEDKMYCFLEQNKTTIPSLLKNDVRRNKAFDWLQSGSKIKGLVLFIKTLGQPNSGKYSLRDVIYWLKR